MRRPTAIAWGVAVTCALAFAVVRAQQPSRDQQSWNPRAAAAYLDSRAAWWATWPNAARDRETFCVSCHTSLPYALARPSLRAALAERAPTPMEARLGENVARRVTLWTEVAPFYSDQRAGLPKTSESRGTEAILNAAVLASRDASLGQLTDETRTALSHMWALQMKAGPLNGGWAWLNFNYEPWESSEGPFFGATIAAIAVGLAPGYASSPAIQDNLKALGGYVQRTFERQPPMNKLMALWASARVNGLLQPDQRASIIEATLALQQDDGGWSMASLGPWKRLDGTPLESQSDGYATGLVTLALQEAGAADNARVRKGLEWLRRNQDPTTGQWSASSLNKQRDPTTDAGRFMSDAATAFAALSLSFDSRAQGSVVRGQ